MKVIALGGCGAMGRHAVATAARYDFVEEIVIADRDGARAAAVAERCGPKVSAVAADAADEEALWRVFDGADVVLNTAGPFYRFGAGPLRAAIEARCHYLDINDDWEPTLDMLALDDLARRADVTAIVGMGASPGISNLLAVKAMAGLDQVHEVYTAWSLEGAEAEASAPDGGGSPPAAVVHFLHQVTGTIRIWRNEACVDVKPIEEVRLSCPGIFVGSGWTVGHPEALTLPRHRPEIRTSCNLMVAGPEILAALRGLAESVEAESLTIDQAAALIAEHAESARPAHATVPPPVFAIATGVRNGAPATRGALIRALPAGGMGGATGVPLAVGLALVAGGKVSKRGVFPPEAAIDADAFFDALAPLCDPPHRGGGDVVFVAGDR